MQYDPRWNKEDVLQAKALCLNSAEAEVIARFQHMIRTPEDLHYYHIERQKARLKANQEYSLSLWTQLKSRRAR